MVQLAIGPGRAGKWTFGDDHGDCGNEATVVWMVTWTWVAWFSWLLAQLMEGDAGKKTNSPQQPHEPARRGEPVHDEG